MKILHCLSQLPSQTGSGIYFCNLMKELDRQKNWQQAALYALPWGQKPQPLPGQRCYPVFFETQDLPFPIVGMSDEMPYPSEKYREMTPEMILLWHRAFSAELQKAKQEFQPDVVICHHLWMLCSLVLKVFPETPVLGISHGTDIRQAKQNPSLAQKEVGSLSALAKVLALSSFHLEDLCQCFDVTPQQILVTGGAFDSGVFFPPKHKKTVLPHEPIQLIYAGKISAAKGVFQLAEAFSLLSQRHPQVCLDLVGGHSSDSMKKIRQLTQNNPAVRYFDAEPQHVLADHLRRCHIFVLPSYYEGLGLIALEALASGLHLVANALPSLMNQLGEDLQQDSSITWVELPPLENLDEICQDHCSSYTSRLASALEHQILLVRRNGAASSSLSPKIASHSWEALSNKIATLIESIVNTNFYPTKDTLFPD